MRREGSAGHRSAVQWTVRQEPQRDRTCFRGQLCCSRRRRRQADGSCSPSECSAVQCRGTETLWAMRRRRAGADAACGRAVVRRSIATRCMHTCSTRACACVLCMRSADRPKRRCRRATHLCLPYAHAAGIVRRPSDEARASAHACKAACQPGLAWCSAHIRWSASFLPRSGEPEPEQSPSPSLWPQRPSTVLDSISLAGRDPASPPPSLLGGDTPLLLCMPRHVDPPCMDPRAPQASMQRQRQGHGPRARSTAPAGADATLTRQKL